MKIWGLGMMAVALTVALTACQKGDSVPQGTEKAKPAETFGDRESMKVESLIPTKVGTQATYEAVGGSGGEITIRISDVKDSAKGKVVKMDFMRDGKVDDSTEWLVTTDGLYQLSARSGIKYEPAKLEIPGDLSDQAEKKYTGSGPYPSVQKGETVHGKVEALTRIRGVETVDTSMGQIEALAVKGALKYRSGGLDYVQQTTTWYSPKYGIVRYIQVLSRSDGLKQESGLKIKGFSTK